MTRNGTWFARDCPRINLWDTSPLPLNVATEPVHPAYGGLMTEAAEGIN